MTDEQLAKWVAEQVSHFRPDDLDAGIGIMRRHLQSEAERLGRS